MKHDHFSARLVFIDGPLALYICEAPAAEILEAYERLGALVRVAAKQLDVASQPRPTFPQPPTAFFVNHEDWPACGGDRNASEFP